MRRLHAEREQPAGFRLPEPEKKASGILTEFKILPNSAKRIPAKVRFFFGNADIFRRPILSDFLDDSAQSELIKAGKRRDFLRLFKK